MVSLLSTVSEFMIEGMLAGLGLGLTLRFMVYRSSRYDQMFFQSFTREVEKVLVSQSEDEVKKEGVESFLRNLLKSISAKLPVRSVRFGNLRSRKKRKLTSAKSATSLQEYTHGDGSLIHSLQAEFNVLTSSYKPNFNDVSERILARDDSWTKLIGNIPVNSVARILEVMPSLFIISGILGTFIGIAQALPKISGIDFSNLSNSNMVLSEFVSSVTYAMNTSIAGIICSFVMTVLNSFFPIESVRENIVNMVDHTLERLWFFLHQGNDKLDQLGQDIKALMGEGGNTEVKAPVRAAPANVKPVEKAKPSLGAAAMMKKEPPKAAKPSAPVEPKISLTDTTPQTDRPAPSPKVPAGSKPPPSPKIPSNLGKLGKISIKGKPLQESKEKKEQTEKSDKGPDKSNKGAA